MLLFSCGILRWRVGIFVLSLFLAPSWHCCDDPFLCTAFVDFKDFYKTLVAAHEKASNRNTTHAFLVPQFRRYNYVPPMWSSAEGQELLLKSIFLASSPACPSSLLPSLYFHAKKFKARVLSWASLSHFLTFSYNVVWTYCPSGLIYPISPNLGSTAVAKGKFVTSPFPSFWYINLGNDKMHKSFIAWHKVCTNLPFLFVQL
jgi:hypothetical protein